MENKIISIITLNTVFIIILSSLTGCNQKEENQQPEMQSIQAEEQSDAPPDQLKDIESSIEKIIKSLNGPAIGVEDNKEGGGTNENGKDQGGEAKQENHKGEEEQKENDQKSKEGGQSEQSKEGTSEGEQQKQEEQKQKEAWEEITPVIKQLHYKWTGYMPLAVKMGANRVLIDGFSNSLNNLTNTVIQKNEPNSLLAANYLYSYIPELYRLYKTKTSPEIKEIRYYTRNAILNTLKGDWEKSNSDINNLKSSWSLFKNTIPQKLQEDASKLDFSIYELEKVISDKNKPLTDIKGKVTMSNIELIEKNIEKEF